MERNHWNCGLDRGCMLRGLLKRGWIILLGVLVAVGTMNLVWKPEHESRAAYVVMRKAGISATMGNMSAANQAATLMTGILQSEVMSNRLEEKLGDHDDVGELSACVVGQSNMLLISATADTPEMADAMLQVTMDCLDEYFSNIDSSSVLYKITDARVTSTESAGRNILRYLFAGILGGGAAAGLLLWLHVKADTIQNRRGAERKLNAWVLATLPRERQGVLFNGGTVSVCFRENLYRLRLQVETAAEGREGAAVILVTSEAEKEGKSTVAANLALVLAEKHKGVLLVDADIRNPSLMKLLGKTGEKVQGLGSLLQKNCLTAKDIAGAIDYEKETNLMTLLGKEACDSTADLLGSGQMIQLMGLLRKTVNYIILDAPAVGRFPDAGVLSDLADQTVLVVRQDQVSADEINGASAALKQGKAVFLGCVLNDMRSVSRRGNGRGRDNEARKMKTAQEVVCHD